MQHSSSNSSSSSSSSAIGSSDRESSAPSAAGGHNANKTTASSAASDQHAYLVSRTTPPQRSDAPLLLSLRGHSFAVVEEELCAAYRLMLSAHEQQLQLRARSSWHTSTAAAVVSRGATRGGGSSSDNFNSISGVGGVGGEYRGASPASSNFNLASVSAFACGGALFATRAIASLLPLSVASRARVALLLARRGWRRLATTTTASTYRPLTPASSSSSSSAVSASPGASPPIAASPSADKATVTIGTPSSSSGSGGGTSSSSSSSSGGLVASMSRLFASLLRLLEPTSSDGDSAAPLLPAVPSAVLVVEGHALRHLLGHGSSSSMPHTDSTFNVWGAPHTNSAVATASASAASGAAHTPSGRMIALPDGSLLTPSAAFLSLALSCGTVICCRCSPAQKASLVTLVRSRGLTTLAIGDGGNDVAMIQAADVGVGIAGREGQQAARAADFSFSRFRFLRRLLLVHGRRSYYRTSLVSQYTFYKSQLICFVQLLFNARCAFSGCSLLDTLSLTGYNMVYTALAGTLLVLDTDEEEAVIEADPTLYRASAARTWITPTTFVAWAARAFTQALIVFILCCGIADGGLIDGASLDQATLSYVAYSSVIVLQMLTLVTEMRRPTALNHAVNAGSLTIYAAQILIRNSWPVSSSSAGTASAILASPGLQLAILLAVVAMALPPWIGHAWGLIDRAQSANSRSSSGKAEVNASRRGSDSPSPRPSSSPSSHVSVRQGGSRNASSLHTSATAAAAAAAASAVGWKQRLAIFNRVPPPSSASPSRRWWSDILGAEAAAAAAAATTVSGEEEGDKEQQQQLQHQHVRRKRRAVHGRHEHQHRHQQRYADDTARSGSSRGTTSGNSGNSSGGPNSSFLPAAVSAPTRSGASASSAGTRTYASLPASALSSSLDSVGGDGRLTRGDYHQLQLSQVATRGDTGGQLQLGGVSSSLPAVPVTPPPPQQPFSQFTHKSAAAAAARSRSNDGASIISGNSSGGGSNSSTGSIIGRIGAALRWGLNSTTTSMPPSSTGSSTGSGHGAVAVALAQDSDDDRTPGTQSKDPRFKVRPGGGAKEV